MWVQVGNTEQVIALALHDAGIAKSDIVLGFQIEEWNESVSFEAIKEAVQLASQAFLNHADEFVLGQTSV